MESKTFHQMLLWNQIHTIVQFSLIKLLLSCSVVFPLYFLNPHQIPEFDWNFFEYVLHTAWCVCVIHKWGNGISRVCKSCRVNKILTELLINSEKSCLSWLNLYHYIRLNCLHLKWSRLVTWTAIQMQTPVKSTQNLKVPAFKNTKMSSPGYFLLLKLGTASQLRKLSRMWTNLSVNTSSLISDCDKETLMQPGNKMD